MAYTDEKGIFHFELKDITRLTGGAVNADYGNNVFNGSAIGLKDGTVVDKPKNIIDFFIANWQFAVLGIIAILVLLRD